MTKEQTDAGRAAIGTHLKACPVCRTTRFSIGEAVTFLPTAVGRNINISSGQPCLSAICKNCGSVQLFNIFALGLGEMFGITPSVPAKADLTDG